MKRGSVFVFCLSVVASATAAEQQIIEGEATRVSLPSLAAGAVAITDSTDTATIDNDVNCGGFSGSSFYRSFKLDTFPQLTTAKFKIDSVTFGIWLVSGPGGSTVPMRVAVYSSSATPPTLASLTLLDSVTFSMPVGGGHSTYTAVLPNAPVMTVATDTLVAEVFYQNDATTGATFFIGGNDNGQSSPTYERAPDCQAFDIIDLATLGPAFGNFSLLLVVNGETAAATPVRLQSFGVN